MKHLIINITLLAILALSPLGAWHGNTAEASHTYGTGSENSLTITNEAVSLNDDGAAVVTWNTNLQATSMVLYDTVSHSASPFRPDYPHATKTSLALVTSHTVIMQGLQQGTTYYLRPFAGRSNESVLGEELAITLTATVEEDNEPVSTVITRLPCTEFVTDYIKLGEANNPGDVRNLEAFLNVFEGFNLSINGVYEEHDYNAVVTFQERYAEDILAPWGYTKGTGHVYYTTQKKINEIFCPRPFPLTDEQLAEIEEYKQKREESEKNETATPEDADATSPVSTNTEQDTDYEQPFILPAIENQKTDANEDEKNLSAKLYDLFADRTRAIGIALILLSFLLAGTAVWRSRKAKRQDTTIPPPPLI